MALCIRPGACIIQFTKRMLCNVVAQRLNSSTSVKSNVRIASACYKSPRNLEFGKVVRFPYYDIIQSDLDIHEKLQLNKVEDKDWCSLRQNLLKNFNVSESAVDSLVCNICAHNEKHDQAINYIKFLENNNYKLNLSIAGTCLMLYSQKSLVSEEDEKEIYRIYDNLRKQYPLLDGKTCNNCIMALTLTKRWKESLELMEMMKVGGRPGPRVVGAIIAAAFRNKELDLAWKMINAVMKETSHPLHHCVFPAYLEYCVKNFENNELETGIEKMFNFWKENNIIPPEYVIDQYVSVYKTLGYYESFTAMTKFGSCKCCTHTLQQTEISLGDFKTLSAIVLKNVIIGSNIYQRASPQELKRYKLFIETMKPYDVVIDGLNVAYSNRIVEQSQSNHSGSLIKVLNVVNYFKNKRVLVIGRAHMNWWSNETMSQIKKKADVFLLKNISEDDPFLLHITLVSGPSTYFVSRDKMRQHLFKIADKYLMNLFKSWQMSRQYMFKNVKGTSQMILLPPLQFEPCAQKHQGGWHLPYVENTNLLLPNQYSAPEKWVCLRKP